MAGVKYAGAVRSGKFHVIAQMPTTKKQTTKTPSEIVMIEPEKATIIKKQVNKAVSYATSLSVESKEDYAAALEEGRQIKTILENIIAEKEKISKPQYTAYKNTITFFKQLEEPVSQALDSIRAKMTSFHKTELKKAEEEKAKLASKVESGYMKPETAMKKAGNIAEPEKTVATATAQATMRTVKKYRVVDKANIPVQFMEPNMVAIKASFRAGTPVAGVEEYEEQEVAIS